MADAAGRGEVSRAIPSPRRSSAPSAHARLALSEGVRAARALLDAAVAQRGGRAARGLRVPGTCGEDARRSFEPASRATACSCSLPVFDAVLTALDVEIGRWEESLPVGSRRPGGVARLSRTARDLVGIRHAAGRRRGQRKLRRIAAKPTSGAGREARCREAGGCAPAFSASSGAPGAGDPERDARAPSHACNTSRSRADTPSKHRASVWFRAPSQSSPPKMPILIKRYANRKLYNTKTSRYITLKGIAAASRRGRRGSRHRQRDRRGHHLRRALADPRRQRALEHPALPRACYPRSWSAAATPSTTPSRRGWGTPPTASASSRTASGESLHVEDDQEHSAKPARGGRFRAGTGAKTRTGARASTES